SAEDADAVYYLPFETDKNTAQHKYEKRIASEHFSKSKYREKAKKAKVKQEYVPAYYYVIDTVINYSGSKNGKTSAGKANFTGEYAILASQQYEDIVTEPEICQYFYKEKMVKADELLKTDAEAREISEQFSDENRDQELDRIRSHKVETVEEELQGYVNSEILEKYQLEPKTFSYSCEFSNVKAYYVLAPIWTAKYKNRHTHYVCIINGQSGEITSGTDEYAEARPTVRISFKQTLRGIATVGVLIFLAISALKRKKTNGNDLNKQQ
ncbi:hypothetical protein IJT93_06360, partial [bacterium]|nr:hypothetical protein [bacterium]